MGWIGDSNKVGEAASDSQGTAPDDDLLKKAYNALKGIVEIAKEQKVEEPKKSELTLKQASIGVANPENGAKVLAAGAQVGGAVGDKAAAIVSAVRGEEMLVAIVNATEDKAVAISSDAKVDTTALEFAVGGNNTSQLAKDVAKAGAVSGGIALRSLVKDGKLAANDNNDDKAVQSAGISAVNKLLVAVEDVVKKTVKNVLDKAKGEIDKARVTKTANNE